MQTIIFVWVGFKVGLRVAGFKVGLMDFVLEPVGNCEN
jgi:hypothetical protein